MNASAGIFVPLQIAAVLHHSIPEGLSQLIARRHPETERVLAQLRAAAVIEAELRSRVTTPSPSAEQRTRSVNARTAAEHLGISPHGVRMAIRRGRLPAREVDGHLVIERADLETYAARRAG